MAVQKVLALNSNNQPQQYTPLQASAGSGSAGAIPALNAAGLIDETMLPEALATTILASEAIAAGAMVNVWDNSGTLNVRNANATDTTKPCNGWAPSAIGSSSTGQINFGGINPSVALGAFTVANIGQQVFLSTVSGGVVIASNAFSSGNLVQSLGTIVDVGATVSVAFIPEIVAVF